MRDDIIEEAVSEHGWTYQLVAGHPMTDMFIYTIGLGLNYQHPELICFGLDESLSLEVIQTACNSIKLGASFSVGSRHRSLASHKEFSNRIFVVRPVHETQHMFYLGYAMSFYRRSKKTENLSVVQLIWPDSIGKYPWDAGCNAEVLRQPSIAAPKTAEEIQEFMDEFGYD